MSNPGTGGGHGPDAGLSTSVEALLEELSLESKVGQLVGTHVFPPEAGVPFEEAKRLVREKRVGAVTAFGNGGSVFHDPVEAAEAANELQRLAVEETPGGVPLLFPVDAVHGLAYVEGGTVFPHALGMGATRDPALERRTGEVASAEMRATGATLRYGPTCDVARDPRWGRTYQTYGESPLLCGAFSAAEVRGLETGDDPVASCLKHFPAYSGPAGGEDAAPVDCSPSTLHRTYLPSFERAIDAGASVVMPCYDSIDGEPAHGSERYLTRLLRERLGFDGVVASDWGGVDMLHEEHRTTRSRRHSARQAVAAGLDHVSIGHGDYVDAIRGLVEDGELAEDRIDEAAGRVLALKRDLGLFEDPYVDVAGAADIGTPAHRGAALEAARAAQTLLRNEGVLPLSPSLDSVLVTGPNADALQHQVGGWSLKHPDPDAGTTVLEGIEAVVDDGTAVEHERGATVREREDVDAAARAAADADAAVVVLGENWYFHEFGPQDVTGPTGAFPTRTGIDLPDAQRALLEAVVDTGTPTALVLVTGRPLAIPWAAEHVPGILLSYYPGLDGGQAVAEVLFGEHNPAGRLPISVPRSAGHLPTRFNRLAHPHPIGDDEHPPTYDPLFPFGHGLSYTEFEHVDLELSASTIGPAEPVRASVTVRNAGARAGAHAVDVFLRDAVSSRVRPVREHVGFAKTELGPGESERLSVEIPPEAFAVTDSEGRREVEPGEFEVFCEGLSATFEVGSAY